MYWKGAHTKHKLKYHIVWLPKYRKRILKGQLSTRVSGPSHLKSRRHKQNL